MKTPTEVLHHVCDRLGADVELVRSPSKLHGPLRARRLVAYLLSLRGVTAGEAAKVLRMDRKNVRVLASYVRERPDPALVTVMEGL